MSSHLCITCFLAFVINFACCLLFMVIKVLGFDKIDGGCSDAWFPSAASHLLCSCTQWRHISPLNHNLNIWYIQTLLIMERSYIWRRFSYHPRSICAMKKLAQKHHPRRNFKSQYIKSSGFWSDGVKGIDSTISITKTLKIVEENGKRKANEELLDPKLALALMHLGD